MDSRLKTCQRLRDVVMAYETCDSLGAVHCTCVPLLREEIKRLRNDRPGEWVSVEDRTPNDGALVLVADQYGRVLASSYNDDFAGEWFFEQGPAHRDHFTHWRPLPEGPSDE